MNIRQEVCAVTGATGYLGSCLVAELLRHEVQVVSITRRPHPLYSQSKNFFECSCNDGAIGAAFADLRPQFLLHCAAQASAALCEKYPQEAAESNVRFTQSLLAQCARFGCRMVYVSTDLVFDGCPPPKDGFKERDLPFPCSVYAKTKREAELLVLEAGETVLRTGLLVGPPHGPRSSPLSWMFECFRQGRAVELFSDEWRTPVYVQDVVEALIALGRVNKGGIYHCGGPERVSRVDIGRRIAEFAGFDASLIVKLLRAERKMNPLRPEDVSLSSERLWAELGRKARALDDALKASL